MTLRLKLLMALVLLAGLLLGAHEVAYHLLPKPPTMQERGLAWLKEEYQVPEDRFRQIEELHRDYFAKCDRMCSEMLSATRPAIPRVGKRFPRDESDTRALQMKVEENKQKQKALCERCLDTMVDHLETVAALMPPEQGSRFLREILPELTHPRELDELGSTKAAPAP